MLHLADSFLSSFLTSEQWLLPSYQSMWHVISYYLASAIVMYDVHRPVFVGLCQNAEYGGNGQVASLDEQKTEDTVVFPGMLWWVWTEINYRLDIYLVTWKFNDKTYLSFSALTSFECPRISY
jgi:hypothetical protein